MNEIQLVTAYSIAICNGVQAVNRRDICMLFFKICAVSERYGKRFLCPESRPNCIQKASDE